MPKRKCASISSSPLFASVAESTVIFGPMLQVGCASASSGVTFERARRACVRGTGRPSPVSTSVCTCSGRALLEALEERGVLAVDRQRPSAAARLRGESRARRRRRGDSLFASARSTPCSSRPERRVDAGEPDDRVQHDVGLRPLEQLGEVAADLLERRVDVVERRRAGRDGAELELRVRLDDLDRLAADRAGGAEEGDAFHGSSVGSTGVRQSSSA